MVSFGQLIVVAMFADTELKVNTPVRIILIDGVKVKVEKWED